MSSPQTASSSAQAAQAGLVMAMATEVDQAYHVINPADLESTLPRFKLAVLVLSRKYGQASGTLAARFYQQMRRDAGVTSRFTTRIADPATVKQVDTAMSWATRTLWTEQPDLESTRRVVGGAVEKLALDVGRATIIDTANADRRARGWARITEPGPCYFCALLATRGAVYKENTAGFESHDHCRCHAEPVFTAYEPSAQIRDWTRQYHEATSRVRGSENKQLAWRRAFENRPTQ